MLVFDVLCSVAASAVLTPLVALLFRLLVSSSGLPALGNLDIAAFLFTWGGLTGGVLIGSIFAAVLLLRVAGAIVFAGHAERGLEVGWCQAGCRLGARFGRLVVASTLTILVGLLTAAPFAGVAIFTLLRQFDEHDINFYLATRAPEFWIVAAVAALFPARDLYSSAVVMSLNYREIARVRELDPRIEIGFVTSATIGDAARLPVDFLAVSQAQASAAFIAGAHRRGKRVFVWTVDDDRHASALLECGVDVIITNTPGAIRRLIEQRAALTPGERLLLRMRHL